MNEKHWISNYIEGNHIEKLHLKGQVDIWLAPYSGRYYHGRW